MHPVFVLNGRVFVEELTCQKDFIYSHLCAGNNTLTLLLFFLSENKELCHPVKHMAFAWVCVCVSFLSGHTCTHCHDVIRP